MALLEVNDLRKSYPTGETALRDVDIVIEKREIVALLGLSGSGKSTLLRCINRLVEPDSGRVVLDGVEITALGKHDLRRARVQMGMGSSRSSIWSTACRCWKTCFPGRSA